MGPETGSRRARLVLALAAVVCAATALAACGSGSSSGPASGVGKGHTSLGGSRPKSWGSLPVDVGDPAATSSAHVTFTPKTVVIDPAQVRSSLVGVSADGSTYTFSNDSGPLDALAPGKVMLLESLDAANVTSVKHVGSTLVVATSPTTLPDLIESGSIHVNAPPDLSGAFGSEVGSGPVTSPASTTSAVLPRSDSEASAGPRIVLDGFTGSSSGFGYSGKVGNLDYSIAFDGEPDGVHIKGDFCYSLNGSGKISVSCGTLLSIKAKLDGVFNYQNEEANISFSNGHLSTGSMSLSGLSGTLTVNYEALRGNEPNINADPPVFKLPFSFEMPVCPAPFFCDGVPLYTKVELSVLVKLGIASKGSLIQGGVSVSLGGSASVDQPDSTRLLGSSSGFHISGKFLPGPSFTAYSSAVLIAVQTKVGLGLGIKSLNVMYYLSFVAAVGQTTPSAVVGAVNPGQLCEDYAAAFTISGNAEAQLIIKSFSLLPAVTLYEKKASYKEPGC